MSEWTDRPREQHALHATELDNHHNRLTEIEMTQAGHRVDRVEQALETLQSEGFPNLENRLQQYEAGMAGHGAMEKIGSSQKNLYQC